MSHPRVLVSPGEPLVSHRLRVASECPFVPVDAEASDFPLRVVCLGSGSVCMGS